MIFAIKVCSQTEHAIVNILADQSFVGVELLSQVIDRAPSDKLNRQASKYFVSFIKHFFLNSK